MLELTTLGIPSKETKHHRRWHRIEGWFFDFADGERRRRTPRGAVCGGAVDLALPVTPALCFITVRFLGLYYPIST
ncbi:uncharacterized protein BDZ99DRAFT_459617 [Mytilinidion resinicola]|uniref:Uncharacterized protein n=1 Tax=Mytilinidion resinicola TaxID=574789 RepID=A0A6A6Z131_9PEZI|nr:uncharacterized protein BDZ99DRAFT_459617 [Mytilinidion resinicola]KAF2813865.1 hypothetical protein BDZ99DRAFT_459617 [Mytilinidion resinicola]